MATLNVNVKLGGGQQKQHQPPQNQKQAAKRLIKQSVRQSVRQVLKNSNGNNQNKNANNQHKNNNVNKNDIPVATPVTATPPTMKFVSHMDMSVDKPVSGTFQGPRLQGTIETVNGSKKGDMIQANMIDNMILNIDAKLVGKTHDGEIFMAHVVGRCVKNPDTPSRGQVRVSVTFETNSQKYSWLNKKVLSGVGRKVGDQVSIDYFDAQ